MSTNSYSKIKSGSADIDQGNTLATRTFTFRSIRNNVTMTTAPSQLEHGNPIPTSSSTMSTHSSTTQDLLLPETYHLIGIENYNEWAFRMMNILKREGLFKYFISPLKHPSWKLTERIRILVMRALKSTTTPSTWHYAS